MLGDRRMVVGVVAALKEEIKPLVKAMSEPQISKWGKRSLYRGGLGKCEVVAMTCGIGKVRAAAVSQYLIDHFPLDAIVCCGVAGAVNPRLAVGDIVVCRRALQHDFTLAEPQPLKKLRKRWLKADPKLLELAVEAGKELGLEGRVHAGTVLTGDQAIVSQEKRQFLWETFGGDCVDMESAAVAQVCQLNDTPFLIVRGISDSAGEDAPGEFRESYTGGAALAARIVSGALGGLTAG
jgi:adenosylhomocysteine nucleosidase